MFDDDIEDLASDRLRGISAIARFIGEDERRTQYMIERGYLPVGREGRIIIGSKRRLRQHHKQTTGGGAS